MKEMETHRSFYEDFFKKHEESSSDPIDKFTGSEIVDAFLVQGLESRKDAISFCDALVEEFYLVNFNDQPFQDSSSEYKCLPMKTAELAQRMNAGNLKVVERVYNGQIYHDCFSGKEFIQWAMDMGEVLDKEAALEKGQYLAFVGLISPLGHSDPMADDLQLFKLHVPAKHHRSSTAITVAEGRRLKDICIHLTNLQYGVEIKDNKYHGRTYKHCFIAREAVTWFMQNSYASTREEAVELGKALLRVHHITHVTGAHDFKDEPLFFQPIPLRLTEIAQDMMSLDNGVSILTRQYKTSSYVSCFLGCEAIDWLVRRGYCGDRKESLEVGQELGKYCIIRHVTGDHPLSDEALFYHFTMSIVTGAPPAPPTCEIDIAEGKLADPLPTPNCISTQAPEWDSHYAVGGPLPYAGTIAQNKQLIKETVIDMCGKEKVDLANEREAYLHFTFESKFFHFIDDVEFIFDESKKIIHFRSASRTGRGDLGANQKRMNRFRNAWIV